jgi:ankyrin repeat protein
VYHGAAVEPAGHGAWTSPLLTALTFGYLATAQALVRRGARVDRLPAMAGLGLVHDMTQALRSAPPEDRHRALALAAQLGQIEAVRMLPDAGEDPNRYNPPHTHSHSTPLHQAIASGHLDMVRLLVHRGADVNIRDTLFEGTALGWAEYLGHRDIADYLRTLG